MVNQGGENLRDNVGVTSKAESMENLVCHVKGLQRGAALGFPALKVMSNIVFVF